MKEELQKKFEEAIGTNQRFTYGNIEEAAIDCVEIAINELKRYINWYDDNAHSTEELLEQFYNQ